MSRKVLGRIIVCVLALAMVLGLCTMTSMAAGTDTSWKVEQTGGKSSGNIGREIEVKITGGDTAGSYTFNVSANDAGGTAFGADTVTVSSKNVYYYKVKTQSAGDTVITVTPDSSSSEAGGTAKTITVSSETPTLALSKSTETYSATGNDFTVTVKNPAEDGKLVVTPGTGSGVANIYGNVVSINGVGTYTVDYKNSSGSASYVGSATKTINVTPQKTILYVYNTNVNMLATDKEEIAYDTTSGGSSLTVTPASADSGNITVAAASGKITINTTTATPGSYTFNVVDKAGGNYSESDSYNIVVNVQSATATTIKVSPNSVTLDKDTSSEKVTITVKNAQLLDGIAYVNVRVAKPTGTAYRGVYIDGNRKSAGNTYRVSPSGSDATFSITLKARYSGKYTLAVTNGSGTALIPVVITGYNTLPQTGPDYSMVYIFAALLTVALGGIVLVNVLKKKDDYSK